jgi:hypothetical protein
MATIAETISPMFSTSKRYVLDIDMIRSESNPVQELLIKAEGVRLENEIMARYMLYDEYDTLYTKIPGEYSSETEDALGTVLFRSSEDITPFTPINISISEFIAYDINKIFGYNLSEYMNLTKADQIVLINEAAKIQEILQKETEQNESALKNAMNSKIQ